MEPITIPFPNHDSVLPKLVEKETITNKPSLKIIGDERVGNTFQNPQQSLEQTLNNIFLDSKEESKLLKARVILREAATDQTDEQLKIFVTELQYLIDSWLDIYEQQVFEGQTLKQLLRERSVWEI